MIAVVDYGIGNIHAFLNVYRRLNIPACAARNAQELRGASRVILPGVGDFDHAMKRLDSSGIRDALCALVLQGGVPLLGVCVGMQMLARSSDEGTRPGLGWLDGEVKCFKTLPPAASLPRPHMGWNDVQAVEGSPLFNQLHSDARFYFLHSYYFQCDRSEDIAATAVYGAEFTCAVKWRNIFGVQFHPEKSHHWGTRLLQNFAGF